MQTREKILIIRLGALGDLVLCFDAFAAIRRAHPEAEIALLTGPSFVSFAQDMPWFDRVLSDPRPVWTDWRGWHKLISDVRAFAPTRVYDLQGKRRQSLLFVALGGPFGVEWSGAAPLCAFPRVWPPQKEWHFQDFIAAQLARAGVSVDSVADLSWLNEGVEAFALPQSYALLFVGCAPGRLYKRWPVARYAEVAKRLMDQGIAPIALGTRAEAEALAQLKHLASCVCDLGEKTTIKQVASLARGARLSIGNDTGPVHLAAAMGRPVITLISGRVNPVWSAPSGGLARYLVGDPLSDLSLDQVWAEVLRTLS